MSVASEIERLRAARNDIRTKLVEMGLAASTNDLDELATAIVAIANNGKVELKLDTETTSRPIPAGYHNGGGRMYITIDEKDPVTPTKSTQTVSAGEGTVLGEVVVLPIPDAYQDVSDVTATYDDVLANKVFVDSTGAVVTGRMTNNGKAELLVDTKTPSVTIPKGYHDGTGRAYVEVKSKSATPSEETQTVSADTGTVLGSVVVLPIPDNYQDVTGTDALAVHVLEGKIFISAESESREGTMPNVGKQELLLDASTNSLPIGKGYHDGTGRAYVVVENEKSITPTKASQSVTAAAGKILGKVTVQKIPDKYQDVSGVTAIAANVLSGKKFVDAEGYLLDGTMANNGSMNKSFNPITQTAVAVPAGYTSGGSVTLTGDLEAALAAI